jgi:hypothetical protein
MDCCWAPTLAPISEATDRTVIRSVTTGIKVDRTANDFIVSGFIVVGPIFGGTSYVAGKSTQTPLGPGGVLVDLTIGCPSVSMG